MAIEEKLKARLDERHAQQRYRHRRLLQTPQAPRCRIDGRDVLAFCSNDYLGLAADPRLVEALAEGARRFGVGGGASHVVNGHSEAHERLEYALKDEGILVGTIRPPNVPASSARLRITSFQHPRLR